LPAPPPVAASQCPWVRVPSQAGVAQPGGCGDVCMMGCPCCVCLAGVFVWWAVCCALLVCAALLPDCGACALP
jgi:hypothetical protein